MKGDPIPDKDHIARLCVPKTVPDGQIEASAFMLRKDEESLPVNWLEFLNRPSRENEIVELRNIYDAKFNRVGAGAKIAVLNVGEVCEKVRAEKRNLDVLHDPEEVDPSHIGIYNMWPENEFIAELIRQTVQETYPARKSVV